jgi:hypothetical protein
MQRDLNNAIPLHIKFSQIYSDVTAENEVVWLKASAELGGFKAGPPRLPYFPLNQDLRKRLRNGLFEIESMVENI